MVEALGRLLRALGRGPSAPTPTAAPGSYQGQTIDDLLALSAGPRPDMIVTSIANGLAAKQDRLGLGNLTDEERVVLAVEAVERDVNSDGFDGLFHWSPDLAPYVVSALTTIGRPDVAKLAQRAIAALKVQGPLTGESVRAVMAAESERRENQLNRLDARYYELGIDLAGDVLRYVEAHRAEITLPGT